MNIDSIIAEWTYRLEKGYPDCPEDYIELRNVLHEQTDLPIEEQNAIVRRAMGLVEDETQDAEQPLPSAKDINILIKAIRDVSEQYARYLKIFNLFDPNSLGTISEVLLAQLISKQGGDAIRVGGSQGLTDVIIKSGKTEKHISLKTTAAGAPINLGSDLRLSNIQNITTILAYAKSLYFDDAGYRELTIKDLLNTEPTIPSEYNDPDRMYPVNIVNPKTGDIEEIDKSFDEIKIMYEQYQTNHKILVEAIENRIDAIANKLSGQDEYFVWAEKKMSTIQNTKVISSIIIHVLNYERQDVINRLKNGKFFVSNNYTGVSWGIKDNTKGMVGADKDGKYLNILPAFVKDTKEKEQQIKIDLDLSYVNLEKLSPQQLVSNSFLNVLDTISTKLFGEPIPGQATDGENDNLSGQEG